MSRRVLSAAALAVLVAGCGGPYKVAPVSGRVTLNGNPVANAAVMFQPVTAGDNYNPGPGSTGVTDADGRYTLTLTAPGKETKGAVVGMHKVRVTNFQPPDSSADDRPKRVKHAVPIPGKYNKQDAILEFDVPSGGSSSADFALTGP